MEERGKILVTGGAGFIGSHVAEFYAKKNREVVVFDNLSRSELLGGKISDPLYNWRYLKKYKNIKLVKGDIRDRKALESVADNADVIFHTAAQTAVTTSLVNPKVDFEVNARGTFEVLEAARKNNSTVIFTSTNKVYGENVNKLKIKELKTRYTFLNSVYKNGVDTNFNIDHTGHSPYGDSKLAADIYMQDYAQTYGLKTGVFRMSCIYGDRQFGVEDQGWVAWFTIAALTNKILTVYGDGKQVRDILFVSDLISVFDKFIKSNKKHIVLNIGGGPKNTISLLELLDMLKQKTGKQPKLRFSDWRLADQKVYISNIEEAKKTLGWQPKITPSKGLDILISWLSNYFNK